MLGIRYSMEKREGTHNNMVYVFISQLSQMITKKYLFNKVEDTTKI